MFCEVHRGMLEVCQVLSQVTVPSRYEGCNCITSILHTIRSTKTSTKHTRRLLPEKHANRVRCFRSQNRSSSDSPAQVVGVAARSIWRRKYFSGAVCSGAVLARLNRYMSWVATVFTSMSTRIQLLSKMAIVQFSSFSIVQLLCALYL